uniref:uncharacterized protein LOC120345441 n=1 Tax=Styela clava TaxID=7725 RepID=UPI0019399CC8|nr:uncharacterized protein LOC120345441 [Styela clava]
MTAYNDIIEYSKKRKSESIVDSYNQNKPKKVKRDAKKNKTTREQERILLENFVKYGILPTSPERPSKSIDVRIPSPISPIRPSYQQVSTHTNDDQRVPELPRIVPDMSPSFWRPWIQTELSSNTGCKGKTKSLPTNNFTGKYRTPISTVPSELIKEKICTRIESIPRKKLNSAVTHHRSIPVSVPSENNQMIHGQFFTASPKPHRAFINAKKTFTPSVTTWNTKSQEFLNSFKQPVKLMWPRSQAYDYKYSEAQHLLQAFPVQAAIGFYDDEDVSPNHPVLRKQNINCYKNLRNRVNGILN